MEKRSERTRGHNDDGGGDDEDDGCGSSRSSAVNDDEKDRTMVSKRMRVFAWRHLLQFLYTAFRKVRTKERERAAYTQFQTMSDSNVKYITFSI